MILKLANTCLHVDNLLVSAFFEITNESGKVKLWKWSASYSVTDCLQKIFQFPLCGTHCPVLLDAASSYIITQMALKYTEVHGKHLCWWHSQSKKPWLGMENQQAYQLLRNSVVMHYMWIYNGHVFPFVYMWPLRWNHTSPVKYVRSRVLGCCIINGWFNTWKWTHFLVHLKQLVHHWLTVRVQFFFLHFSSHVM